MKRQSSLIQKSNDLEEYKTELAVCIEQKLLHIEMIPKRLMS